MPSPSSAYISAHSSSLSVTSPGRTSKSRYTCSSAKIDGSSYLLAWLIIGVLVNNFVVAPFFFFWWHQAAWHRVAAVRELNELEVTQRAWEVESHIQLGDRLAVLAFKVGEASLRAVAARQLKDIEATQCAQEGDRAAMVIFEVKETSSRVAWVLEDVKAARCKAAVAREVEEANRMMMVFEVRGASSREGNLEVLHLMISST
jgi:hypothetical protein